MADQAPSLARILSQEQMPRRPNLREKDAPVEMEKWIAQLEDYLRRLLGKFTAANIVNTIINQFTTIVNNTSGLVINVDQWYKINGVKVVTYYLGTEDWRGREIDHAVHTHVQLFYDDDIWNVVTPTRLILGHALSSDYQIGTGALPSGGGWSLSVEAATGKLKILIDTTGFAGTQDHIRVIARGTNRKTVQDVTN